jgi:CRP/FNR family nitrogen fixation transcriptional regulator
MLQVVSHARSFSVPPTAFSASNVSSPATATIRTYETKVTVKAGEAIFHEGDDAIYFYKVLTGAIRLVKSVADGHRQICDFNLPGDLLGYSNAAEHEFTAEAIQDCTLIRYRRKDATALIKSDPAFACELQTLTAKGLSSAYAHMVRLCHRSAHDRLAWFLLSMADRAEVADGWIVLPMTRVDIGDYLGLAHETVSRAFTQLKKARVIVEPTLNRIKLINREALEDKLEAA